MKTLENSVDAKTSSGKVGDIQVLRGIAILMVLFCHLSIGSTTLELFPVRVTMPFYLGVEIFFVVSGYVITRSLMKDGFNAPRFLIKRVFRLTPAMLCFIALTFALNRYVRQAGLSDAHTSLFSVPEGVFRQQAMAITFGYFTLSSPASYANSAMWSLSIEDQFYAGMALLCLTAGLIQFRRLTAPLVAAIAGVLYLGLSGLRFASWLRPELHVPAVLQYLAGWRFDLLAAGVLLAFIDFRFSDRVRRSFAETGPFISAFALVVPVILAGLCESPLQYPAPVLHGVGYTAMGLCFCVLVLLAANGLAFPASRGPLYQAIRFVGDRSYTYYLFHFPMFIIAWIIFNRYIPIAFRSGGHFAVVQCLFVCAALLPFGEVIYRCVELPLAERGRAIADKLFRGAVATDSSRHSADVLAEQHPRVELSVVRWSGSSEDSASDQPVSGRRAA